MTPRVRVAGVIAACLTASPAVAYTAPEKACIFAALGRLPRVPKLIIRTAEVSAYAPDKTHVPAGSKLTDPKLVTIAIAIAGLDGMDTSFTFICGTSSIGGTINTVAVPYGSPK